MACTDRSVAGVDEVTNGGNGVPDAPAATADARPTPTPDAPSPQLLGCTPLEEWKGTCVCTAETCTPGTTRWCDGAVYCDWGIQTCGPDGAWGQCTETSSMPAGCSGRRFDIDCCLAANACCQSLNPGNNNTSLGNCPGLVQECRATGR